MAPSTRVIQILFWPNKYFTPFNNRNLAPFATFINMTASKSDGFRDFNLNMLIDINFDGDLDNFSTQTLFLKKIIKWKF